MSWSPGDEDGAPANWPYCRCGSRLITEEEFNLYNVCGNEFCPSSPEYQPETDENGEEIMSTEPMWIDTYDVQTEPEGAPGFLIEIRPQHQCERYRLRSTPARTNNSQHPLLDGWCGSYNNTSTYACGVWKAVRRNPAGDRTLLEQITDPQELRTFLEEVGYPELISQIEKEA